MSRSKNPPYHHGDLKRALVDAALRILESQGPAELTFRRLAKDVQVSHAAPLAHFPDRLSLDAAIASRGFRQLDAALSTLGGELPGHAALPPPAAFLSAAPAPLAQPRAEKSFLSFAAGEPAPMGSATRPAQPSQPSRVGKRLVALALAYVRFALERPGLYRAMYDPELARRLALLKESDDPGELEFLELAQGKGEVFQRFLALAQAAQRAGEFRGGIPAEQIARLFLGLAEGLAQQYSEEKPGSRSERLREAEQLFELQLGAVTNG